MPEQDERGYIFPTLFIGLGGTGKEILIRLRRKFYERFGKASLPCTGFLWIDTDIRAVGARGEPLDEIYKIVNFRDNEQIQLLNKTVGDDLGDILYNPLRYSHIHRWLYKEVGRYGAEIRDGAGNVRAIGRLTLFSKFEDIKNRLEILLGEINSFGAIEETKKIEKLKDAKFTNQIRVFVITSVVGGTGAGIYLDIAFLLRDLQQSGTFGNIDQIISLIILPNVYYPTKSDEVSKRSYGNAYAALKELEYYTLRRTRAGIAGGSTGINLDFEVEWRRGENKRIPGPPFTISYLIEATNEAGISLTANERNEFFHMIANSLLLDFLPGQFSTDKRSDYANVASFIASERYASTVIQGREFNQVFAQRYASFGFSKIEIPEELLLLACSNQLAYDILNYWNRSNSDPYIKDNVLRDMSSRNLLGNRLSIFFGTEWKDALKRRIQNIKLELTSPKDIEKLRKEVIQIEQDYLYDAGRDRTRWGSVINYLRSQTSEVIKKIKGILLEWIANSIEKPEVGISLLSRDGGYIDFLVSELQNLYMPKDEHHVPEFEMKMKIAKKDSEFWQFKLESLYKELNHVLKSKIVNFLGMKKRSIEILTDRFNKYLEQWAFARAEVCLYDELKKIAKEIVDYIIETKNRIIRFKERLGGIAALFLEKKKSFLSIGDEILSIRIFDNDDWDTFYVLDCNEEGKPLKVSGEKEGKNFVREFYNPKGELWSLIEIFEEEGESLLINKLQSFCEKRFRDDFLSNPRNIEVINHPRMLSQWSQNVDKLVRTALPMLKVFKPERKIAYFGINKITGDEYQKLIKDVTNKLNSFGYSEIQIRETNNPSEVYLYTVCYAFPIANIPLIFNQCHEAYYEFYRNLRQGQVLEEKNKIPLHINKTWEGKFSDLRVYDDRERTIYKEASEVLLIGSVLKIVNVINKEDNYEFSLLRRIFNRVENNPIMGSYNEALDFLKENFQELKNIKAELGRRKSQMSKEDWKIFYFIIAYLYTNDSLFPPSSVEKSILEILYSEFKERHGREIDVWDSEMKNYDIRNAPEIEWIGEFPRLKNLEFWIRD